MTAGTSGEAPPGEAASRESLVPPGPVRRSEVTSADGQRLHVEIHGPQDSVAPTVVAIMAAAPRESVLSRTGGVLLASTGSANLVTEALAVPFAAVLPAMVPLQHWLLTSAAPLTPFSHLSRSLLSYLTLGPGASAELAAANTAIIQACDRRARAAWGRVLAGLDVTAGVRQLDVPAHVLVGHRRPADAAGARAAGRPDAAATGRADRAAGDRPHDSTGGPGRGGWADPQAHRAG